MIPSATLLVLTNADTDLLALRSVVEGLPAGFPRVRAANPHHLDGPPDLDGVACVLVRLLGGRRAWPEPFDALRADAARRGIPLLALGGEAVPDAELAGLSSVPSATVAQAFAYWSAGGLHNVEQLLRFVADTTLMGGWGFEPPVEVAASGVWGDHRRIPGRPGVGICFYRAHVLSGNTQFVDDLCRAVLARGCDPVPVWTYSLRGEPGDAAVALLAAHDVDVVVTTVLAAGRADGDQWEPSSLAGLDVPILQALASTASAAAWEERAIGLPPVDVAMQVAIPEFDGRIIGPAFSFKEQVDDADELGAPVSAYRTVPDRVERVAGVACRLARLRGTPPAERRIALVLSAYPTKRSRLGNAVALDTPASIIDLLHEMAAAGYAVDRIPADGDELMAELADGLIYDREALTPAALTAAVGRWPAAAYRDWFATLPEALRADVEGRWGEAPGAVHTDPATGELVFAGLTLGHVLVAVQPPRGFGDDPVAVYHAADLAPTHQYLGFYRWLDLEWGADAVVHVGKHGTLEWLPGKSLGLSASCAPDAALGDLPFVYPFVVNDPGEGTQAKRRAHATIVDHLLPPMTRAESYDDLARLESLLDEHARIESLDPSKLPAIRRQVWDLLVESQITRDLGLDAAPEDDVFSDVLLHVDGYLCELKDAQVRGGLHTLGRSPQGEALVDLVLAITRQPQGRVPSLRAVVAAALDVDLDAEVADRHGVDAVEAGCRQLVEALAAHDWNVSGDDEGDGTNAGGNVTVGTVPAAAPTLAYVAERLVPALRRTPDELGAILASLDGRFVAPGPSGAPTRGMAHVLPTGRNFYSVDPGSLPSPLAWEVGRTLADRLIERHVREEGRPPVSVGLVVWGTAAMRTGGDDVAEALALLGVAPVWEESGRVAGLALIPDAELGRPRVDVVVRISGFFRDAFPHLVALLDEAVELAGFAADGDPRIFGARPGGYGSGILPLLESRGWRSDDDLAEVYVAWGGWAYGRSPGGGISGRAAPDALRRRFAAIEVAVKNQDNREHDIFDSDDYLQDHGGMVATIRALTGRQPKAWFGDSADPARPRVRSLQEEAARVVRTRVLNPKWIEAMRRHGYKGAFELAATVDYLFGYDATAHVLEDWMYEKVTEAYVADPEVRKFLEASNPWALRSMAEKLLEADERGLWDASPGALATLRSAVLEAEGWEEGRS
ncbi:MAG: cobaltochelatase subunit CobN [Acidimicrobiales bacterium]